MKNASTRRAHGDALLDERIAARAESLGLAEQQVAIFFAERRDEVPFMSAADIAAVLETSNATVVRAAQALGYAGLRELKEELGRALRKTGSPTSRIRESLDELATDATHMLDNVLAFDIEILQQARRSIDHESFERAVDLMHKADRIVVLAPGFYPWVAAHFVMSLHRYGRPAISVSSRGNTFVEELLHVQRSDAVVAIAYEKPIEEVMAGLDHVSALGCPVVLVTDVLQLVLKDRFTVALAARRGRSSMQPTAVVTLAVIEALLLGLAGRDKARVAHAHHELDRSRAALAHWRDELV
jgi:DNA-binding MurR/RpiR family transcriptional regulator